MLQFDISVDLGQFSSFWVRGPSEDFVIGIWLECYPKWPIGGNHICLLMAFPHGYHLKKNGA
jgi:hypothetical protein